TVSVVPPVVEWRRYQHGRSAPGADESPQRPTESENIDGRPLSGFIPPKRGAENQRGRRNRREDRAKLNHQMGRRPEGVAAYGLVPGDVPVQTAHDAGGCRD